MAAKKSAKTDDPTVTSEATAEPSTGAHPAVPIENGADAAVNKQFKDNPDKPAADSVAQLEVLPEDK